MSSLAKSQTWYTWENYEISDGLIQPVKQKGKPPTFYRPMDYFTPPTKREIHSLYLHFGNINMEDDRSILFFVNRFGLLGLQEKEDAEAEKDNPEEEEENPQYELSDWGMPGSLAKFKEEVKDFKFLLKLAKAIRTEDESWGELENLAGQIGFNEKVVSDEISLLEGVRLYLSLMVSAGMEGVQPVMAYDNGCFNWKWNFPSLLACIYLQLFLVITGNYYIKKCRRSTCGIWFATNRRDAQYCSDLCQNAASKRRRRANQRKEG